MHNSLFLPAFPHRKVFCICFRSSRTEFGINVSNAKYTILEIASDWSHVPKFYNNMFFTVSQKFYRLEAFYYMSYVLLIL